MRMEKIIMQISALSGLAIGAMEFIMFLLTGSQAILIDGLYDWMGVVIILSYVFIQPLLYRPVSEKTPYGYAQIETVFVLVKCSILICMTVYIIFDNLKILFGGAGGNQVDSGFIARFELAVFLICLVAWLVLRYFSKKIDAPMISAEMMEWRLDVYLTFGSFVGFSIVPLLQRLGIFSSRITSTRSSPLSSRCLWSFRPSECLSGRSGKSYFWRRTPVWWRRYGTSPRV